MLVAPVFRPRGFGYFVSVLYDFLLLFLPTMCNTSMFMFADQFQKVKNKKNKKSISIWTGLLTSDLNWDFDASVVVESWSYLELTS